MTSPYGAVHAGCCEHCQGGDPHEGPCPTCQREGGTALADGDPSSRCPGCATVVTDLRWLAREWGEGNEHVASVLMDAAAYFEGTL